MLTLDSDVPLSPHQQSLAQLVAVLVPNARQVDFYKYIASVLRPIRDPNDQQVRHAINSAYEKYRRPAC
jgi:hypothetical protein